MVSPRPSAAAAARAGVAALPLAAALELEPDALARLLAAAPKDELRAHPEVLLSLARMLEPLLRLAEGSVALQRVLALSVDSVLRRPGRRGASDRPRPRRRPRHGRAAVRHAPG